MRKNINDVDINYIRYGDNNGEDVVLLHGWGQNIEMMKKFVSIFVMRMTRFIFMV